MKTIELSDENYEEFDTSESVAKGRIDELLKLYRNSYLLYEFMERYRDQWDSAWIETYKKYLIFTAENCHMALAGTSYNGSVVNTLSLDGSSLGGNFVLKEDADKETKSILEKTTIKLKEQFPEVVINTPKKKSKEGCYVATWVYGGYNNKPLWILRRFRDQFLNRFRLGQRCIQLYYHHSPNLVKTLRGKKTVNRWIRYILNITTTILKFLGFSDLPY